MGGQGMGWWNQGGGDSWGSRDGVVGSRGGVMADGGSQGGGVVGVGMVRVKGWGDGGLGVVEV